MEDLLVAINKEMKMGINIWISVQTNSLKDFGFNYPQEWGKWVGRTKNRLESEGYLLPQLPNNMRNST